jgi:hypothetical protein
MRIFVSYRSVNRAIVEVLISDLKDMEHEVWYDQELEGGQKWWDNILNQIYQCDLLIFAVTAQSLESRPCQFEYTYANALRKPIIPVMLESGINYNLLPIILQERQIVDYTRQDKAAFKTLSNAIKNLPAPLPLPDPLPEPPPVPISPLAPLKTQIDSPVLSYEEQVALVHQLKGYLNRPEYVSDARQLLVRLSDHQTLLASVLKDIQEVLASEPQTSPPGASSAGSSTALPTLESQKETPQEPVEWLQPGEEIKKELYVSLLTGAWTGKRMVVTSQRVLLAPGMLAVVNRETIEMLLQEITDIKKTMTRLMPTVEFRLKSGHHYTIMLDHGTGMPVGNRDELISLVKELM